MADQPAAGTPKFPLPDKTAATPVSGNVTVEGHGKFTGRDDNSINVAASPGAIVAREVTVVQQVATGKTRRLTAVEGCLAAVREYCANLPYLTLHDIRPPKTLDEVCVPPKAQLAWTDGVIDQIVYRSNGLDGGDQGGGEPATDLIRDKQIEVDEPDSDCAK